MNSSARITSLKTLREEITCLEQQLSEKRRILEDSVDAVQSRLNMAGLVMKAARSIYFATQAGLFIRKIINFMKTNTGADYVSNERSSRSVLKQILAHLVSLF